MIKLSRIVLVNWYAFGAQDVDLRGSAAIIGPNGAGKSSLLDALQVVLTGNNANLYSLNASSNVTAGRGRRGRTEDARSVFGYCLGRLGGDKPLRESCITYLALVFERERDGRKWTVGLGLSAREEDIREDTLGAFIAPDQDLRAADFLHELPGGGRGPLPYDDLVARLKRSPRFENFGHRPTMFIRHVLVALRGRHGYAEPDRFLRTIRNALRFREMSSANEFVRDFILDDDKLDVEGLRASVQAWRNFQNEIEQLERQKARVEEAIAQYVELLDKQAEERRLRWVGRRAARDGLDAQLGALGQRLGAKQVELADLDRALERTREAKRAAEGEVGDIRAALATDRRELAIARFREVELPAATRDLEHASGLRDARLASLAAGAALGERLSLGEGDAAAKPSRNALSALASRMRAGDAAARDVDAVVRATVEPLSLYADHLRATHQSALYRLGRSRDELKEAHEQLRSLTGGKAPLRSETRSLIAKLDQVGIEARPLAELVEVADEDWCDAAETMLGAAREALIVAPGDAHDATAMLRRDRREHYGCQVVNTTRTARVPARPAPDSLAEVIETDDPHARAFLNTRLNGIVRVGSEAELLRVERGVTPDCLSASGGSIEARQPARFHLLGSDGRERSRPLLEARVAQLERDLDRLGHAAKAQEALIADVVAFLAAAAAPVGLDELEAAVAAGRERVNAVEDNIRTLEGERPQGIRERLADLERDLEGFADDEREDGLRRDVVVGERATLVARVADDTERRAQALAAFDAIDGRLDDADREAALGDYRALAKEFAGPAEIRRAAEEQAESLARRTTALAASAPQTARQYAYEFKLQDFDLAKPPADQMAWLREQLARIEGNQLVRYREQAAKARAAIEEALRSDLLIKLYTRIEGAKEQIGELNRMLRRREFHRERYAFEIRPDPAYADIVHVAKQVYDNEADVTALFEGGTEQDGEVGRGVARIQRMLEGGEDVTEVSDYRNYLQFELVTKRVEDDVVASNYSRRQQSGSGGEKQVPFYIAISSAIAATCHHRETERENMGLGLALFDEAFNALDGGNVSSCLSLMGEFNLQVIACAPSEKLATFMEHMETVVTINRDRHHVQIDVEYPTELGRRRFRESNPANMPLEEFRELRRLAEVADAAE